MNKIINKIRERPKEEPRGKYVNAALYFIQKFNVVLFLQKRNRDGIRTQALLQKVISYYPFTQINMSQFFFVKIRND